MKSSRSGNFADRRLRAAGNAAELDKILQEECRRRASRKLAATLLCPDFKFPTRLSEEQCSSDDLAKFHASLIPPGATVVDLTAGLAIDAFHCARRANSVLAIERDPAVAAVIEPNATALGLKNVSALQADCIEWLQTSDNRVDVMFIDPARRDSAGRRTYSIADCSPNLLDILPLIRKRCRRLIAKLSPMLDIKRTLMELPEITTLHVCGTENECKELVADINFEADSTNTLLVINTIGRSPISYPSNLRVETENFAPEVKPGDIIGEPWPAVAKARPRGILSGQQLHPDTLLWLNPTPDFPGRLYRVTEILPFNSATLKQLKRQHPQMSVAVRNFPMSAAELKNRIKAGESDTLRLLATTTHAGGRQLLVLTRAE